jgi:hypothetical protein
LRTVAFAGDNAAMPDLPDDVVERVRSIFASCNKRAAAKMSRNPNAPEESFDLTWIEHLSGYSAPMTLASQWLVKIETHFLGGMRHFGSWEIADIGVLVDLRLGDERQRKVALLQSKRLYPNGTPIREESAIDYRIGFARLADPEDDTTSIAFATEYRFDEDSAYAQIIANSPQVTAIDEYQAQMLLKVYYHLYNPWSVPFVQHVPLLPGYNDPDGEPDLGVRVLPAGVLHQRLGNLMRRSPRLRDLADLEEIPPRGWRLEEFVCNQLLACHEGDPFDSIDDDRIQGMFFRRTGAIAAAISITIEAPDGVA